MVFRLQDLPQDERDYLPVFGRLIVEWNLAESNLRGLLTNLVGDPRSVDAHLRATIMVAELGGVGIENALRSFADTTNRGELGDALKHVADHYSRLRVRRNYYVHGILTVIAGSDKGAVGTIHYLEAKGKVVERRETVPSKALEDVIRQTITFKEYVRGIINWMVQDRTSKDLQVRGTHVLPPEPPMQHKLEKPVLYLAMLFAPSPT
jgi:hypothetical protein